jgi:hypothetical protein
VHARIGVIANPRSHAHRAGRAGLDAVLLRYPDIAYASPADPVGLQEALRRFAASGVDLLVVSGGDGTLRHVLSALPDCYPGAPPRLAILAAGNTNLAARVLGSPGRGVRGLERLLVAARAGTLRHRSCAILQVSWVDEPDRQAVRGFLLGAAAFVDGKRIADAVIHRRGMHEALAVAATLALTVRRMLFPRPGRGAGTRMQIGLDGHAPREGHRFLLLATTLHRLLFGLWPFWGAGPGAIHLLEIDAPPRRAAAALFAVLRRRPAPWMAAAGYRSARAGEVRLVLQRPFVLDGERFEPGPHGVLLSAPDTATVVFP